MLRGGKRYHPYQFRKPFNGDFSLPGYNYLGPGNAMDKGAPTNKNDAIAFRHDVQYGKIQRRGKNPYVQWSNADEDAFNEFTFDDYGGAAGKVFFGAKKLAYKAGLIGNVDAPTTPRGQKRLRGSGQSIEPQQKPLAKKPNLRDGQGSSVVNLPPGGTMADGARDGGGSGNAAGLKETPIDEVHNVHRGIPDFTFSSLPFVETRGILTGGATWGNDHTYRMTSPYDPAVTLFGADLNTGTGLANTNAPGGDPDSVVVQANWFGYYASIYNYYHVMSCRYRVYVENKGGKDIMAHLMFFNQELPPQGATNDDIMTWPQVRSAYLKAPYNAIQSGGRVESNEFGYDTNVNAVANEEDGGGISGFPNYESGNHVTSRSGHVSTQFSGVYTPGDFRREIHLDSEVENWTSTSTNPALPERLLLRIKPTTPAINANDTQTYGDFLTYKIVIKLEYLVEFKELKSGLRWPVQRNPAFVAITQNITTGEF